MSSFLVGKILNFLQHFAGRGDRQRRGARYNGFRETQKKRARPVVVPSVQTSLKRRSDDWLHLVWPCFSGCAPDVGLVTACWPPTGPCRLRSTQVGSMRLSP